MSIKRLIRKIGFTGITLNIGFIGLNFAGGSSKVNIAKRAVLNEYNAALFYRPPALPNSFASVIAYPAHEPEWV